MGSGLLSALILQLCDCGPLASISPAPGVGLRGGPGQGWCQPGVVPARPQLARGCRGCSPEQGGEGEVPSPQQKSGFC